MSRGDPRDAPWESGGCHCGAVRFFVRVDGPKRLLRCNCSICTKKAFLHFIAAEDALEIELEQAEGSPLCEYRFGTRKAVHMFCRHCGISPFYRPRSHPESWSVNARCFDGGFEGWTIEDFDGQNWEQARAALRD